jgi:hypothetical protein
MARHNAVRYACDTISVTLAFWVLFWLYPQANNAPTYGWAAVRNLVTHPLDPNVWCVSLVLTALVASAGIFTDWYIRQTDVVVAVFITSGFAGLWMASQLGYDIDHFLPGAAAVAVAALVTLAVWVFVLRPHPKG